MHYYALLRIAFVGFLMYLAFPYMLEMSSQLEFVFWTVWVMVFFFIVGGNVATLLKINQPPVIEQTEAVKQKKEVQRQQ